MLRYRIPSLGSGVTTTKTLHERICFVVEPFSVFYNIVFIDPHPVENSNP